MANCKNCSKPIELKQGRRPREFCDNNQKCRNEWFRKNKKAKETVTIPIEKWNEIEKQLESLLDKSFDERKKVANDMADFGMSVSKINQDGNFKRVHPLSNEAMVARHNAENKDSHMETLEYPTDFQSLLKMAKEGVDNMEAFKMAVNASKLAPNQKSMVLSKINPNS